MGRLHLDPHLTDYAVVRRSGYQKQHLSAASRLIPQVNRGAGGVRTHDLTDYESAALTS